MEPPRRTRSFLLLLAPPLIAMGLAAVIAYVLSDAPPAPSASGTSESPLPAPPPAARQPAATPSPRVAPAQVDTPGAEATPADAPRAPAAVPAAEPHVPVYPDPVAAALERLADPALRPQAQRLVFEGAKAGLRARDPAQLQRMRAALREHGIEDAIPARDLSAIELGIACLTHGGDAKAQVVAFLAEHPDAPLSEPLRAACP